MDRRHPEIRLIRLTRSSFVEIFGPLYNLYYYRAAE